MIKYFPLLSLFFVFFMFKNEAFSQDLIERTQQQIKQASTQTEPNELAKLVTQNKQSNARFNEFDPFEVDATANSLSEGYALGSVNLTIKEAQLNAFIRDQPAATTLKIPVDQKSFFELELFKVDLFAEDFIYRASDGRDLTPMNQGVFYRGIVKGDNNSIASASIFGEEIRIMIGDDDGNYVIGKLKNAPSHVLYNDRNLLLDEPPGCSAGEAQNLGKDNLRSQVEGTARNSMAKCIPIYVECDYDMYTKHNNSEASVIAFVSALINETATIYANEQIDISLSDVKVWTTIDPYASLNSTNALLQRFGELTKNNYNGRLAHLISTRSLGGGIAWVDVLCSSYFTFSGQHAGPYAVSASMGTSITTFPTYSWNVEVFAHEMGHNMGSPHTQNCSWNGNNTAIDACASTEGGCTSTYGACPPGGGTIMSYCHITSCGIDFNNGFGPQPGDLIRNRYNNASCTLTCAAPTCDDGVQNGDEEGVDCGGSSCAPCPCYENQIAFSLRLDNFPTETSWTLKNSAGVNLYSGGGYNQASGLVNQTFNLPPATGYQFTINDSYGDGICCGYGNGSFSLTDNQGAVIASGGAFGATFSITFCTQSGGVVDNCPNDPNKTEAGICGCGVADTDSDNDNTPDCNDGCPNDPNKIAAGICGCGVADTDSDNDNTPDCDDDCPNDPNKIAPGICGCGIADNDSDNDNTPDCNDGCPNDPNKIAAGICGCGVADTDSDNDNTPDCNDGCPNDPNKIAAGICGCGVADTDSDNDNTPDCRDECPNDPNKIVVGVCGCGVADTDTNNNGTPDCEEVGLCPETNTVTSNLAGQTNFNAQKDLVTSGSVIIEDAVTFKAGESITLTPGFHATYGSTFSVVIEGCTPVGNRITHESDFPAFNTPSKQLGLDQLDLKVMPNPFSGTTKIEYQLAIAMPVLVQVMDVNGRIVKILANNSTQAAGMHQLFLDGSQLQTGVYYISLMTPEKMVSKKVILMQ